MDLGLPSGLKWATCNVGATRPEEYGEHFAWGETKPKSDYSWATYKWCKGSDNNLTKYCPSDMADYWGGSGSPDNKLQLDLKDDAAWVNWGGNWHMPTKADWRELIDNCTRTWTINFNGSGVAGRIFTSNQSGYTDKSIFFPAAGYWDGVSLEYEGKLADYWASSLNSQRLAWLVSSYTGGIVTAGQYRCYGLSVRPVTK